MNSLMNVQVVASGLVAGGTVVMAHTLHERPAPVTVKTSMKKKKAYNKLYRKWRGAHPGPQSRMPGYHCSKRAGVKCK